VHPIHHLLLIAQNTPLMPLIRPLIASCLYHPLYRVFCRFIQKSTQLVHR